MFKGLKPGCAAANLLRLSVLIGVLLSGVGVSFTQNTIDTPQQARPSRAGDKSEPKKTENKKSRRVNQPRVIKGYVLTHEHPMNGMAFGGNYAFAGSRGNYSNGIMTKGYTEECGGCRALTNCDHGEIKGKFVEGQTGGDMGDHGSHKGPVHDSFSHLRYATDWIRAAFDPQEREFQDARMRMFVAFAVESEMMCEQLHDVNEGNGGAGGDGHPCSRGDSRPSLKRQLDAIKAWVEENSSWMEIAYSAADARRIVSADKLAIVLGVEAEYAFGAEDRTFDPVKRLRDYYDDGVRTFYLAHKINSRLAGADIYYPKNSMAGKAIRAQQAISGCFYYDDNVRQFPLVNAQGHNFCDNNCGDNHFKGNKFFGLTDQCVGRFSELSEANTVDYILLRGDDKFNGFKIYPTTPGFTGQGGSWMDGSVERNRLGLSHDGERIVREAMIKGMIVNIDHVSSRARQEIRSISRGFGNYPLNALHNNPNEMLIGSKGEKKSTPFPHEYDFDTNELKYVSDTGGFFGVRVGPLDSFEYTESGVIENCPKTITETAKILAWLINEGLSIGYALDFAAVTQGVYSRTFQGCGLDLGLDYIHTYSYEEKGKHREEVTEGLSHVGVMKAWHKELETIGLKPSYVDQLKNDGVEAFLEMWETSEAKSTVGKQIERQTFESRPRLDETCNEDSDCADDEFCSAGGSCKSLLDDWQACTKHRQCASDHCKAFRCYTPDSKSIGDTCWVGAECREGKCNNVVDGTKGTCVCRDDSDCGDRKYCTTGANLTKNSCEERKSDGKTCGRDEVCASGHCKANRCYTPNSKEIGDACFVEDECRKGKCNNVVGGVKGTCVCRSDSDCSGDRWCDMGVDFKQNACRNKFDKGEVCGTVGELGVGHRCKSGKCKTRVPTAKLECK